MRITIHDMNTGGTVLFVEEQHSDALFDALFEDLQLHVTEFLKRASGHGVGLESPENAQTHMKYTSMIVVPDKSAHELAQALSEKFGGTLRDHDFDDGYEVLVGPRTDLD